MLQLLKHRIHVNGARTQGAKDAECDLYAPDRYIASLGLVAPDVLHDRTDLGVQRSRLLLQRTELHLRLGEAQDTITAGPPRLARNLGMVLLGLAEGVAIVVLFIRELEFSPIEAVCFSSLLTPGSFYLTHLVRKHVFGSERRWWAYALLALYMAFALTLTYLRTIAHGNEETSVTYSLAIGFLLCLATLLPGWFMDQLREDVASTAPQVRAANTIDIRIDQTAVELEETNSLSQTIAEHDAFLQQVRAAYDTAHDTARATLGKPRLTGVPKITALPAPPPEPPQC